MAEEKERRTILGAAIFAAVFALVMILLTVLAFQYMANRQERDYRTALGLYEDGTYEEALTLFSELGGYKDSADRAEACREHITARKYAEAVSLFEEGEYEQANEMFGSLGDYEDSQDYLERCGFELRIESYRSAKPGDTILFGTYEQDGDPSNGAEEIEWIVLDREEDRILVISLYGLDSLAFDDDPDRVETFWYMCSLRTWLNGSFLSTAFREEEREMIPAVTATADLNPDYSFPQGYHAEDQVFLLSIPEVFEYFGTARERQCSGTGFCYEQGADRSSGNGCCWWWLRTRGAGGTAIAAVRADGTVDTYGYGGSYPSYAVRPAMWIDLGS